MARIDTARGWDIVVRRQNSQTFGVYGTAPGQKSELLEGGFFSRAVAERARDHWLRECLQADVEEAERRAGWDPNP